jgi:dimethylglycine dehydrogenase
MADLSVFSKFRIKGNDAFRFIDQLGANRAPDLGRIALTHALTNSGGIASEFSVAQASMGEFYLASAATAGRHDEDLLRSRAAGFDLQIDNVTDARGVFAVMGPNAEALLRELCDDDLSLQSFPWFCVRRIHIAGIEVDALRLSYVGEAGFELHHDITRQSLLLKHLMQAGSRYQLGFYGAFAMNSMRLEKGYRAWGSDLTTERTPLEAGLGYLVKSEGREFIGRDAMLAAAQAEGHWSMHLLEFIDPEFDPFYSHVIYRQQQAVGMVTSGAYGFRLKRAIGLAYFRSAIAIDDDLEVEILGCRCAARIITAL